MTPEPLAEFFAARWPELLQRLAEHTGLTVGAVAAAVAVGVPLGIAAEARPVLGRALLGLTGIFQTIPSLALLALFLPLLGIGAPPALAALTLYALLPVVRNTALGLRAIDPDLLDAGRSLGMTDARLLAKVRLPLALPSILAGIRTATAWSVGIATIAAFIGAGGLGEFINRGLALNSTRLLLLGALPAAALALALDGLLAEVEHRLQPWKTPRP